MSDIGGDHPHEYAGLGPGQYAGKPSRTYRPQRTDRCCVCNAYLSSYNPEPVCSRPTCHTTCSTRHDHGEPPCPDPTPECW